MNSEQDAGQQEFISEIQEISGQALIGDYQQLQIIIEACSKLTNMTSYQCRSLISTLASIVREFMNQAKDKMEKNKIQAGKVQVFEGKLKVMEQQLKILVEKLQGGFLKKIESSEGQQHQENDNGLKGQLEFIIQAVSNRDQNISDRGYKEIIRVLATTLLSGIIQSEKKQEKTHLKIAALQDQILTQNQLILALYGRQETSKFFKQKLSINKFVEENSQVNPCLNIIPPIKWIAQDFTNQMIEKQLHIEDNRIKGKTSSSAVYGPIMVWSQKNYFVVHIKKIKEENIVSIGLAHKRLSSSGKKVTAKSKNGQLVQLTSNGVWWDGSKTGDEKIEESFKEGDVVKVQVFFNASTPLITWIAGVKQLHSCKIKIRQWKKEEWVPYISLGEGGQISIVDA